MKHLKIHIVAVLASLLAPAGAGAQSVGDVAPAGTGSAVGTAPAAADRPAPDVAPAAGTRAAAGSGAEFPVQVSRGRSDIGKSGGTAR